VNDNPLAGVQELQQSLAAYTSSAHVGIEQPGRRRPAKRKSGATGFTAVCRGTIQGRFL